MVFFAGALNLPHAVEVPAALTASLPPGFRQHREPGVWLAGPPSALARSTDGFLSGTIGHVAGTMPTPAALYSALRHKRWRALPDGHYSCVAIDPGGTAVLLRGLSGGERLYTVQLNESLWFSTSLRFLLNHPQVERRLDAGSVPQLLAIGMVWNGARTHVAGVDEVKPGKALWWQQGRARQRWFWDGLLEPQEGSPAQLARGFRDHLTDAVVAGVGAQKPIAVSLSGGIDSAAIACAAVDAFGADQVVAYTYEFADAGHSNETAFARAVCKHLGITRHRVFPVHLDAFLNKIPETVWRAESFVHWPKAFMLLAAERIRDDGFDRVLSGFGVGSHMGTLSALGDALEQSPKRWVLPRYWRVATARRLQWLGRAERLHPALALPSLRLLPLLAMAAARSDLGRALATATPWLSRPLKRLLTALPACGEWDPEFSALPLARRLQHQSFAHLLSCIDVTRWEQPLREVGVLRLSPAHYASVLPYAYLPYAPGPSHWDADRMLRPGKHLLRVGFAGDIPESVRTRHKHWGDAVISRAWLRAGVHWMRSTLGDAPFDALGLRGEALSAAQQWDRRSPQATVTALAFWQKAVLLHPAGASPTWRRLLSDTT